MSSHVCSPHHLASKSGEEALVFCNDHIYVVWRFADVQLYVVWIALTASVKRNEETIAAALNGKCYFTVVAQNYRTHVEAVWSYRRKAYRVALWHYYRSAYTERVCSAACRRADDESVSLVSGEVLAVHVCVYGYH